MFPYLKLYYLFLEYSANRFIVISESMFFSQKQSRLEKYPRNRGFPRFSNIFVLKILPMPPDYIGKLAKVNQVSLAAFLICESVSLRKLQVRLARVIGVHLPGVGKAVRAADRGCLLRTGSTHPAV
jgi:hypothetical protein